MRVKNISFPTNWEDKPDIEKANIEIFVTLEDDYTYIIRVATAKNIESFMEKEKMNYVAPHHLFVIVKELTKDIIEETIKAYAEKDDGYWLKFYHFAGNIDKNVFDKLQAKHIKELNDKPLNESSDS